MSKPNSPPKKRTQLIRLRERRGLSGPQLAKKIGASRTNVYRIEAGVSHPSLALMQKWIKALGPGATLEMFWDKSAKARPSRRNHQSATADAAA